jgi:hypothetical protein
MMDAAGAVDLSPAQCLVRVRSSTWGRVAISIRTIAMVIPVPIRTVDDQVVFATARGSVFDRAVREQAISIQAEGLESADGDVDGDGADLLWSVVVSGICRAAPDPGTDDEQGRLRYNALAFSMVQGWRSPLLGSAGPPPTDSR